VGDVVVGSVPTAPGSTTATRTSACSSWHSDSDQPLIPHFVAAWTPLVGPAVCAATDETRPPKW
jgi:hypothetical protein